MFLEISECPLQFYFTNHFYSHLSNNRIIDV